jgi:hydrogenase maturation protein HypF
MGGRVSVVAAALRNAATNGAEIRVRGRVQGVGFRPAVWRLATELGLCGEVINDADGVLIRIAGSDAEISRLIERLPGASPPLARIERIESRPVHVSPASAFHIGDSVVGRARTEIAPDAAICAECAREVIDPFERRYRYAFATCTHCGPRLSIAEAIPYDRALTTMAPFPLCDDCLAEYRDSADRRFHAEATACHACGPQPRLVRLDGGAISFDTFSQLDAVDAVATLLRRGHIVALKGLGGYQLVCDATNTEVVARLRQLKARASKPFALMARDLAVIERYCQPSPEEYAALTSTAAPIVLMRACGPERLPEAVAPGLGLIGFMLPTTPLHLLALRRLDRPVVMTSGNPADEPQIVDDAEALKRLAPIAEFALVHDRRIAARIDDSVVRVIGGVPRLIRRARGFAPAPITLPKGFGDAPDLLAMGGELKAAFCLLKDGKAILSQHQGDLEQGPAFADYERSLLHYRVLFDHAPVAVAVDRHPDYLSSKSGRADGLPVIEVSHHHAHVAACLSENGRPLDAAPVLGIALDGAGWGDDGTIWGGEFLLADYRSARRLGTFKPVALLGGAQAMREPWRNLYAHLRAEMSWAEMSLNFAELEIYRFLAEKPRPTLERMLETGTGAPLASSCGRLFDAVAAALDLCRERQGYEGEAAARLEAIVDASTLQDEDDSLAYPFAIPHLSGSGLAYIEPLGMWNALLGDLILDTPPGVIAARFHKGVARALTAMAIKLAARDGSGFDTVALSGGCFQNAVLLTETVRRLEDAGFGVLTHSLVPANDGGLALGQAAIAAATLVGESA